MQMIIVLLAVNIVIIVEIKKRENTGKLFLHELNTVYNKLSILEQDENANKKSIEILTTRKHDLIKKIIEHRDTFSDIDKDLTEEINRYIDSQNSNCCWSICFWHNKKRKKTKGKCKRCGGNVGDSSKGNSNNNKNKLFKWFVDHFWKNRNNDSSNGDNHDNHDNSAESNESDTSNSVASCEHCNNCGNGHRNILPMVESNV